MKGLGSFFVFVAVVCAALAGLRTITTGGDAAYGANPILWVVAFILFVVGSICMAAGSKS